MPEAIRNRREVFRDAFAMWDRIAALLREGPQTVPDLAVALGAPAPEVLLWLAAMLRYGAVEAKGKANQEGYYAYLLKEARS
ncbi:MAG: MarR family transcriptional regulator [Bryobacteraceae bacterium]